MKAYFKTIVCVASFLVVLTFMQGIRLAKILKSSILFQNAIGAPTIEALTTNPDHVIDRELLYEERRDLIIGNCRKINSTTKTGFEIKDQTALVDKIHSIYYCPLAKTSSTFWKRVLTVLTSKGKFNSPFDITFAGVKLSKFNELSKKEIELLRKKGSSFMFVRDPYARLFSGYENKLYHANVIFWKIVGRQVVRVVRNSPDDVYKNYGFDVTFPEFIKYILNLSESGQHINYHFSPMFKQCNPCSTYFQYIGKFETFTHDADYLISKWKNEFDDVSLQFDDFEKETVFDTAKGHVRFLFETKKVLDEIKFPFIKIMLRTWRDLQIRGYLSKYIEFPFKESDTELITTEEYLEAIQKALNIPVNRTEVKLQRQEALAQAYSQVPIEDMERLRHYVLKDCLLFGYDDRPQKLFDRHESTESGFTYLEGLSND